MRYFFIFIGLILSISLFSQDWLSVTHFSGTDENFTYSMCKDINSNVYFFGRFADTAWVETMGIKSAGGNDIFIGKINSSGNIVWLKRAGSDIDDAATGYGGISINESENCLYITGTFQDTCEFESTALISQGGYDIYLAKYSLNGNLIWAKNIGWGLNSQVPYDIQVDINGDVIIDGYFQNSIDFDGGISLLPTGGATTNNFIAKLNNNGVLYWARKISQSSPGSRIKQIACDSTGYYFNGYYIGSFNLDIGTITSVGVTDMFVYKTDYDGNGLWVRKIFGVGQETGQGITTDCYGNVYVGGYFQSNPLTIDSTDIDISAITYSTIGNNDILIVKYDKNGKLIWSKSYGSAASDIILSIAANQNLVTIAGAYAGNISFGSYNLSNSGNFDVFLVSLDTIGNVQTALPISAALDDRAWANLIDYDNNLVVAGDFTSPSVTIGSTTLNNAASPTKDVFIAKYGCPKVTLSLTPDSITCPGGSDGEITVAPGGMTAYAWSSGGGSETETNLSEGTYTVTVTGQYGCKYIDSLYITNKRPLEISMVAATYTIDCAAGTDGVGIVVSQFGDGPYSYLWDNGEINDTAIALDVDTHIVTVTDGCGFLIDSVIITNQPTLSAVLNTHSQLLICAADTNGEVTVQTTNGVPPFSYLWDDGIYLVPNRNNLDTGWHYVTVTDVCNVPNLDSIKVNHLPEVNINITGSAPTTCINSADGFAEVFASSGVPPYSYLWSDLTNAATTNTLDTGWAYVTVSDFCISRVDSVLISSQPAMTIDILSYVDVTCTGLTNGQATVTVTNGVGPYTYVWSGSLLTTAYVDDLDTGWVYVTVNDVCGALTDSVHIGISTNLTTTMSSHTILVLCETSMDGEATVTAVNGVPPITYNWTNGVTSAYNNTLPTGMNYVTVNDACGIAVIDYVLVNYMPAMNASITESASTSCINSSDGYAYIFATSGVPPYNYAWSDLTSAASTITLDTGWAYVTVSDYCISIIDSVLIGSNPAMTIDITAYQDVSCPGYTDGEATVTALYGAPPYYYAWAGSMSTNASVNDLAVGWQAVTVTDGCGFLSDSVFIGTMPTLVLSLDQVAPATCSYSTDGAALVTTSNGTPPFTYAWSGSLSTDSNAVDLAVGMQIVTVTDGCGSYNDTVMITYRTPLAAGYSSVNILCNNDTTGGIIVTPVNGVLPYSYAWSVAGTDSTVENLGAGTYSYTVTDFCGSVTGSVILTEPGALSASFIVTNESFTGMGDGKIDLIISGGEAPYDYLWSNEATTEDIYNLNEGEFSVTITDYNNCTLIDTVEIETEYNYIEIMNAFTPNGDGTNDTWTIKYIDQYPGCHVDVFNQWGMNVFSSTGYLEKWNGKKNNSGSNLPSAAYYYIIDLGDGTDQYTGSVTIIR